MSSVQDFARLNHLRDDRAGVCARLWRWQLAAVAVAVWRRREAASAAIKREATPAPVAKPLPELQRASRAPSLKRKTYGYQEGLVALKAVIRSGRLDGLEARP